LPVLDFIGQEQEKEIVSLHLVLRPLVESAPAADPAQSIERLTTLSGP
jgi:hypothetical protein